MEQNLTPKELQPSERFTNEMMRQFAAVAGRTVSWTEYQRTLAQHLFLKVDATLKDAEMKRLDKNEKDKLPFIWQNVNMRDLALDGKFCVDLGIDALLPAHLYPIPYLNTRAKQYDIDLRIGYEGELYFRMRHSNPHPKNIRIELVYATDKFKAIKEFNKESYTLEITNPFDRGDIIGGFGYIQFEDETKNKLVLVTPEDFKKSRSAAKTNEFWDKYTTEMKLKTVVRKTCKLLKMDPKSVNASSLAFIDKQDSEDEAIEAEIAQNANQLVIDVTDYNNVDTETGEVQETTAPEQPTVATEDF